MQLTPKETRTVALAVYIESLHICEGRPATDSDLQALRDASDKWQAEHPLEEFEAPQASTGSCRDER